MCFGFELPVKGLSFLFVIWPPTTAPLQERHTWNFSMKSGGSIDHVVIVLTISITSYRLRERQHRCLNLWTQVICSGRSFILRCRNLQRVWGRLQDYHEKEWGYCRRFHISSCWWFFNGMCLCHWQSGMQLNCK